MKLLSHLPRSRLLAVVAGAVLLAGCIFPTNLPPPLPTLQGPESEDLVARIQGWIVMDKPRGGIIAIELPTLKEQTVIAPGPDRDLMDCLTGPDASGRIVYLDEKLSFFPAYHVRCVQIDGSQDRELFSGSGSPLSQHPIGSSFSLHSTSGELAYLTELEGRRMEDPPTSLFEGALRILNVTTGERQETGIRALDRRLAWLPNSRSIVYTRLMPREQASDLQKMPPAFRESTKGWRDIPSIHFLDLSTREERFVSLGMWVFPTLDPRSVIVSVTREGSYRVVDLSSGEWRPLSFPGGDGFPRASLGEDLVLFCGLPTNGTEPEYTKAYSPLRGPQPLWSLKVMEISTGRFQTILPHFDQRRRIGVGTLEGQTPTRRI